MPNHIQYRQGDILLSTTHHIYAQQGLLINQNDQNVSLEKKRPDLVLAIGEKEGHAHVAVGLDVELWEDNVGTLWLKAPNSATITHPEHSSITVAPGTYEVIRQHEYAPGQRPRNIAD